MCNVHDTVLGTLCYVFSSKITHLCVDIECRIYELNHCTQISRMLSSLTMEPQGIH